MNISVSQVQGNVPVTLLRLEGRLDSQNFQELIDKAQELYNAGTCNFLLDLSDLTYISSSGLVALCSIAMLARGEKLPTAPGGLAASVARPLVHAADAGTQKHFKLLNPRPEIVHTLDVVGLTTLFDVFTDLEQAVGSFS